MEYVAHKRPLQIFSTKHALSKEVIYTKTI